MTSINLLYIDDDQPQQVQFLIDTLIANSNFDLKITHKPPSKMSNISSDLRNDFDGIIIDQKLDNATNGLEPVDYFGAALAQNLRTLMAGKSDNIPYKPVFLFSLETLLIEYYNPDSTSHDLFDLVISKSILEDIKKLNKKTYLMASIVKAYKFLHYEKNINKILNISNSKVFLDKRFENYVQNCEQDIHKIVGSVHTTLLRSSGMLVSERTLATRLGIDISTSPDWYQVIEKLNGIKYSGIFSDYYHRWWWAGIELWINDFLGSPIFKGLTSEQRVIILKEKLGLTELNPIGVKYKNQSTKYWVNCVVSGVPLDTIDAVRTSSMDLKPWEEDKYLAVQVILERQAGSYKVHPEDRMKLDRIRARFSLE
ncbi:hypothetical protein [Rahnella sp. CJA17(1/100)]|uniref:hypothetical protein n=1 Tax=Rahnella sp. CJA17(1/100) TaxID=2508951 RepID=UPI00106FFC10|nr:hypothetical protein [Rahnella sp. CJA17(1/100)]